MKLAILLLLTISALGATGCHPMQHRRACKQCSPHNAIGGGPHGSGLHGGGPHGGGLHGGGLPGGDLNAGLGRHGAGGYYGKRRPGHADYIPKLPLRHAQRVQQGPPGPSVPSYAYPYYTTRGPRDFLMDNPPTIGR